MTLGSSCSVRLELMLKGEGAGARMVVFMAGDRNGSFKNYFPGWLQG